MRDALHWVSRSMTSTRRLDQEAAAWASITAMVDLPTPPFLFDTAKNCVIHHPLWKRAWVEGVMRFVDRAQHQSLYRRRGDERGLADGCSLARRCQENCTRPPGTHHPLHGGAP